MKDFIRQLMPPDVFKALLLDLEDRIRAAAQQAHIAVRDTFKLNVKRSRELEGQARFRLMEEAFEEVCAAHGGQRLQSDFIPLTDLRVFQPFHRFEHEGRGFILGLAAIPEPSALPAKNMSRRAAVTLNYHLQARLDLDGTGPKVGDVFILLLVARDRAVAGQIEEIAIGVINSGYEQYLHYETLPSYLQGHADESITPDPTPLAPTSTVIQLKPKITPFVPPEKQDGDKPSEGEAESV